MKDHHRSLKTPLQEKENTSKEKCQNKVLRSVRWRVERKAEDGNLVYQDKLFPAAGLILLLMSAKARNLVNRKLFLVHLYTKMKT